MKLNFVKYSILLLLPLTLVFCGSDEVDDSLKVKKRVKQVSLSEISTSRTGEKALKITGVKFGSFIDVENDIEAIPALSDKEVSKQYNFRWYVNDREIEGENNSILSNDYFREDDWIFCRVNIQEKGETYPEFKSSTVRIKGALPRLNLTEIEPQNFPGTFRYKINAFMPENENDETEDTEEDPVDKVRSIRFELISPLEKGIELDPLSGEIVWDITQEIIDESDDKIKIKFSVISPSGRKINSSISLVLNVGETGTGKTENGPSLGNEIE